MATFDAFRGLLLWVWDIPSCMGGDLDAIVAQALAVGATGLIVKVQDANHGFNDWNACKTLRAKCRAAGLRFISWGYDYSGSNAEENAVAQAVSFIDPDAHVADVEAEWETNPNAAANATSFLALLRKGFPDLPLAYAPLPIIHYHLRLPYYQFTVAGGCAMLPQLYWTALKWPVQQTVDTFYADALSYNLTGEPIFPAYMDAPGYTATDAEVDDFATRVLAEGAAGISVWSFQHLGAPGSPAWQRVAQVAARFAPPPPVDPIQALKDQIAQLEAQIAAEQAKEALLDRDIAAVEAALATLSADRSGGK